MSLEVSLICDGCGRLIDAGKTGAAVRAEAKRAACKVSQPGGRDYCWDCVTSGASP